MIFPRLTTGQKVAVKKMGREGEKQVVIESVINDIYSESYAFREPVEPFEIGKLYRLFFDENYPGGISEQDRYFIALDSQERIIGGISYKFSEDHIVQLNGIVVSYPLTERGIGSAMVEDFCTRMASQGAEVIKTHFFLQRFYLNLGFQVDKRWGALVKFLKTESKEDEHVTEQVIPPTE